MRSALTAPALSGEWKWAILFAIVVHHELACPEGQLLSEAVDRALAKRPGLVYGFTAITVAHLLNKLPRKADPYVWVYLAHQHITRGKYGRPIR